MGVELVKFDVATTEVAPPSPFIAVPGLTVNAYAYMVTGLAPDEGITPELFTEMTQEPMLLTIVQAVTLRIVVLE